MKTCCGKVLGLEETGGEMSVFGMEGPDVAEMMSVNSAIGG